MNSRCFTCGEVITDLQTFVVNNEKYCLKCYKQALIDTYKGELPKKKNIFGNILNDVEEILNGDRHESYGDPIDSCTVIASYWNTYLEQKGNQAILTEDIPIMMILFKIAREAHKHKNDNLKDIIGYTVIADYIQKRNQNEQS